MKMSNTFNQAMKNTNGLWSFLMVGLSLSLLMIAPDVLAGPTVTNCQNTGTMVKGFVSNLNGLLNVISVAVVTIAIIFAGYQIAFAHKRIADVAPILIGGVVIGAAAQIAGMVVGDPAKNNAGLSTAGC